MTPMFFGPAERPLFGWRHDAPGAVGVVICSPFGYEAICAHRSLRRMADMIAAAGAPVVRFDHDGTGDSAGDDRDPERLAAWVRGVHAAIATLGTERVILVGIRLGALIAALAAAERRDVEALIAIAPVVSGRAHVRELKLLQGALGLPPPRAGAGCDDDAHEAVGFVLTAETRAALAKVDLCKQARPPAPRVAILDRDDLPGSDAWAAKLADLGAALEVRRVPGYVEMMLDPHKTVIPTAMIVAVIEAMGACPGTFRAAAAGTPTTNVATTSTATAAARFGEIQEEALHLPGGVFGLLTSPTRTPPSSRALLLLNPGAVHHVGPNRLWTTLARRWAARGDRTLRIDITGIGDACPRPGAQENVVYSPHALDDVAAAVAHLRALPGVTEVRAVGLCSGAYYGFKAAVAGQQIDGVVAINPLTFFWHEGLSLDPPAFKDVEHVERYQRNLLRVDAWKKVLRGDVDLRGALRTVSRYACNAFAARARDVARMVGSPLPEDLGTELETIARRGIDLRFVFSAGDPGLGLLRGESGSALPPLLARRRLTIDTIDGADHTFTQVWTHAELTRALDGAL